MLALTALYGNFGHAAVEPELEQVKVWGVAQSAGDSGYTNPTSLLLADDIEAINVTTTEDLVKFEPSLVIRRRFIGDSNGTLGIRGSNMFQTSRSMVFADGVPLHYFLQSRWNGAPRWSMVSASEIAQVEVLYGPFSALYSGNSMGGVVLIETKTPQDFEFNIDGTFISQEFSAYNFDDRLTGFKGFISAADRIGNFSYYLSYNHLENQAQPQTYLSVGANALSATENPADYTATSGALLEPDSRGFNRAWFGDTGVVSTATDTYKIKLGYHWNNWQALLNIAYETRDTDTDSPNNYLQDETGQTLWRIENGQQDGYAFSINENSPGLIEGEKNRESLSVGLRVKGDITNRVKAEININQFDILKDYERESDRNPKDPDFINTGTVFDDNNSGWQTAELKFTFAEVGGKNLEITGGVRHENYNLSLAVFNSPDYINGRKGALTSASGGKAAINAVFTQANWSLNQDWDIALGLRYEAFKSQEGFYSTAMANSEMLERIDIPSSSRDALSPKLSVGYTDQNQWQLRYSVAKAHRFPIVEELFSQFEKYNAQSIANPDLKPEDGLHHNLMFNKPLENGFWRINLFQETIKDAIESQTDTTTNIRTFVPIDKVRSKGIEWVINSNEIVKNLDLRFNVTYTNAVIASNASAEISNPETSIRGNQYPRIPRWRANLLSTYHLSDAWRMSANLRYASNTFGRLDNTDIQKRVYGAHDHYTQLGVKTTYQLNPNTKIGLGIDNLTNKIVYVAHPYPGRTAYLNIAYEL